MSHAGSHGSDGGHAVGHVHLRLRRLQLARALLDPLLELFVEPANFVFRAAARGETVLAPPVAARLVQHVRAPEAESLTPRETEVLDLVGQGMTNAEIGRALFISEATVKTHLLRVFAKLGVDDRTRAVMVAYQRGLLEAGPAP